MNWPVPESYSKTVPESGAGCFWEDRGDRRHCGVDIYAPAGSDVVSIEDGEVSDIGKSTSPDWVPYWNTTYYVLIENNSGLFCRYGELNKAKVCVGDHVKAGQVIGSVGTVLNDAKIDENSPDYIQKFKGKNASMLHFELWSSLSPEKKPYFHGNFFGSDKPENLLNATDYLKSICRGGESNPRRH